MHIDLQAVVPGALASLVVAGVAAVGSSILATGSMKTDISYIKESVQELRQEVKDLRKDLYTPKTNERPEHRPPGPAHPDGH